MKNKIEKKLKQWYLPLITGILLIAFSIWIFVTPISSFVSIAWLLSLGFVFVGVVEIVYSISNRHHLRSWGWDLAGGMFTLLFGLILTLKPGLSALLLSIYIGFWLLFRSVLQIVASFELKRIGLTNWGWILVMGILSSIVSFILLVNPEITGIIVSYWIGIGVFLFGLLQIVLALGMRKVKIRIGELKGKFVDYDI